MWPAPTGPMPLLLRLPWHEKVSASGRGHTPTLLNEFNSPTNKMRQGGVRRAGHVQQLLQRRVVLEAFCDVFSTHVADVVVVKAAMARKGVSFQSRAYSNCAERVQQPDEQDAAGRNCCALYLPDE